MFIYQVIAGAPEGTYLIVLPMASLKEMDEQPAQQKALVAAMGPDNFGRMMKGEGDVFQTMETTLFAVSPEMSYMPKATEDEDPGFWRRRLSLRLLPQSQGESGQSGSIVLSCESGVRYPGPLYNSRQIWQNCFNHVVGRTARN